MPFGCFFGFDFLAEFFVFGVFGFTFFALVAGFEVVSFFVPCLGFAVVRFFFVVYDDGRFLGGGRQADGVGRGGRGQQHQGGEQEGEQDRELPHGSLIGAGRPGP
jgi:hypothetical protein